ncbi:hypothetical protein [Sphingopyxis flava]|uniref:Uncharacterized protein n=1 Tax=Sphingopyxis flava TaxID=1507287 RepID=A0A1T5CGI2_9SPHN|nr:hypothetical protein [Sphingopyxis flava]SKB58466.1 hypothetical protein SAMN06295937_101043 [Sphingopyxis flava]
MTDYWPLELAALEAIGTESAEWAAIVDQLSKRGKVRSRDNTGGGFFVEIDPGPGGTEIARKRQVSQKDVWLGVERLDHGLGIILHLNGDGIALLEGYAVGLEDTLKIDFERARFEVTNKPGPLATNDS